jgi:hypothetical protein
MKTIISENKLHDVISKYIDDYLEGNKINWTYGLIFDESEYDYLDENKNFLIFYNGDWEGEEDSDVVFHYFDVDYYNKNDASHKPFRDKSPILEVQGKYAEHLNSMFSHHWKEPMKEWFKFYFDLPVKTVTNNEY